MNFLASAPGVVDFSAEGLDASTIIPAVLAVVAAPVILGFSISVGGRVISAVKRSLGSAASKIAK